MNKDEENKGIEFDPTESEEFYNEIDKVLRMEEKNTEAKHIIETKASDFDRNMDMESKNTTVEMLEEEDDYLNFLSFYYSVRWEDKKIFFPYENGDSSAIIENQRTARIRFKNLSDSYKEGLYLIVQDIMPEVKNSEIKKIIFKRGE